MKSFLVLILLALSAACESAPKLRVSGGNPATFTASGTSLVFLEISRASEPNDDQHILWEIRNNFDGSENIRLQIVYGTVPGGFRQRIPDDGKQPAPLVTGSKYRYVAMGNTGAKIACFEIRDGKVAETDCN